MNFTRLNQLITTDLNLPQYHFNSLLNQLQKPGFTSYDQLSSWPQTLRQTAASVPFNSHHQSKLVSLPDQGAKALLTFADQVSTETVFIPTKADHYSICVSSQSGCPMGCTFCATGKLGLIRSLTAEEICDQFFYWLQTYPKIRPKSVVFMGMGEPFANQNQVFQAISWLHDYYNLGYRHMTVSTCGLPTGIAALATTYPQVNLAISLHAATQNLRQQLMPIANKVPLTALSQSIQDYLEKTNRRVTFEYLLLDQVNDTPEAITALISWVKQFPPQLVHLNLIPYNPTGTTYRRPLPQKTRAIMNQLLNHQIITTIRKSFGTLVDGACGQLALINSS